MIRDDAEIKAPTNCARICRPIRRHLFSLTQAVNVGKIKGGTKMHAQRGVLAISALIAVLAFPTSPIHGQTVVDFYKGNTIRLIVGNGPGGDYDTMGRLVSKYLANYIPGNPSIIVQNMPGANGVIAANYIYNVAPKDGSIMGTLSRQIPTINALGRGNLQADARQFGWLGGLGEAKQVCFASSLSSVKTAKDLFKIELTVGSTSPTSGPSITPFILNKILGTKFHVVEGYRSTPDVILAVKRGEVDGFCHSWALIKSQHNDMLQDGSIKPLLHMEESKFDDIPNLPSIFDLANDDQKESLRFIFSSAEFGVSFVLPPNVPDDRLKALQKAFIAMISDPKFIAEASKRKLDITFHNSEQLVTLVNQLRSISPVKLKELEKILPSNVN